MVLFPRIWPLLHYADCTLHFATRNLVNLNRPSWSEGNFHEGIIQLQKEVKATVRKVLMLGYDVLILSLRR